MVARLVQANEMKPVTAGLYEVVKGVVSVGDCQKFLGKRAQQKAVKIVSFDDQSVGEGQAPAREKISSQNLTSLVAARRADANDEITPQRPAREQSSYHAHLEHIAACMVEAAINKFNLELGPEEGQQIFVRSLPKENFPGQYFAASRDRAAVILMAPMRDMKVTIFPQSHVREIVEDSRQPQLARMAKMEQIFIQRGSMLVYDARLVLSFGGTFLEDATSYSVVVPRRWPGDTNSVDDSIGFERAEVRVVPYLEDEAFFE